VSWAEQLTTSERFPGRRGPTGGIVEERRLSSMPHAELSTLEETVYELEVTDNIEDLLAVLPQHVSDAILENQVGFDYGDLIEIVLDLGRRPEARYRQSGRDRANPAPDFRDSESLG
jgi:hypothetical protein